MIKLSQTADSVAVKSPYDSDFVAAARSIGGKWDREQGLWVFPSNLIDEVRQIMMANSSTNIRTPRVLKSVIIRKITPLINKCRVRRQWMRSSPSASD